MKTQNVPGGGLRKRTRRQRMSIIVKDPVCGMELEKKSTGKQL